MVFSRYFLVVWILTGGLTCLVTNQSSLAVGQDTSAGKRPPNVLMIAIDDLNDWMQPLHGHPQAITPGFNRLAARAMTFTNAHCQAPLCNPSRTSLLLSQRPSSTGIYGLEPWFRQVPELAKAISLPQAFRQAGYTMLSAGKIYHGNGDRKKIPGVAPEFDVYGPAGGPGITPPQKLIPPTPSGNHPLVDWGTFAHRDEQKGDWQVAAWAEQQLAQQNSESQPFFLAVGFFLPHVPCHVTQRWWDLYPESTLVLPPMMARDREDCSPFSWYLHWSLPEPRLSWLEQHRQHQNLVRAYLASVSFVDSQLDRVLRALDASTAADNTIVVVWSDHGFHLGEKEITGKNSLWERSTRVPLFIAGPGIHPGVCDQPVELLDVFPTLTDLAGLVTPGSVQGVSLRAQLNDPRTPHRPAITDHNPGNSAVRDSRYRLIHYADGSEELYDMQQDPNEFTNRIGDPSLVAVASRLRQSLPKAVAPVAGSAQRTLERVDDLWYWEGKPIDREHPPMDIGSTLRESLPQ